MVATGNSRLGRPEAKLAAAAASSNDVLEAAARQAKVDVERAVRCWRAVGRSVADNFGFSRGTRIDGLGTFTLDAQHRPSFSFSSDFLARHRVIASEANAVMPALPGATNAKLSLSQVAAQANEERSLAERVVATVLQTFGDALKRLGSARLSLYPVAELTAVAKDTATMNFLQEFRAAADKSRAALAAAAVPTARARALQWQLEARRAAAGLQAAAADTGGTSRRTMKAAVTTAAANGGNASRPQQRRLPFSSGLPTPPHTLTNSSMGRTAERGAPSGRRGNETPVASYSSSTAPSYKT
ncbi:unnamed protein product, partial [Phaeothamnion confervicola]